MTRVNYPQSRRIHIIILHKTTKGGKTPNGELRDLRNTKAKQNSYKSPQTTRNEYSGLITTP